MSYKRYASYNLPGQVSMINLALRKGLFNVKTQEENNLTIYRVPQCLQLSQAVLHFGGLCMIHSFNQFIQSETQKNKKMDQEFVFPLLWALKQENVCFSCFHLSLIRTDLYILFVVSCYLITIILITLLYHIPCLG